ncbi:hypothetical protein Tco_1010866, partial [Tanacetum coccineum]
VFFDFHLTLLMAKKDMHTYVSRLKDTELETLIATYDIPLDLRPRLPDPNFRMINLPAGDTAIASSSRSEQDRRAIPFHMRWRHPDSGITDKVPTGFNQDRVDRLKAHVVKLCDIPEGVLVRSGLSRVWRNPMCDPVLRHSDNIVSMTSFACLPWIRPHELGTSILGRVADRTTSPFLAGTDIPCASPKEIVVTLPDQNRTRSGKKGSGAGSSEQAARDEVQQTDDGTLDDDDQRDGPEFAMKGNKSLYDVSPCEPINVIPLRTFDPGIGLDVIYPPILLSDKEVRPHQELPGGVRRTTSASFRAPYGAVDFFVCIVDPILMTELVILLEMCLRGIFSLLSRDLITFLILLMRALGATFLLTPETIRKKFMESILVYDRKNFTRILRNEKDALALKKEKVEEELVGTKSQLEHHKRQAEEIQGSIASFFQSDFTPLVRRFLKSSEFNRVFAGVLNTAISVGVERGFCMDRIDEEFRGLSQKVVGFIPDAKEKFDRVIVLITVYLLSSFLDKGISHSLTLCKTLLRLEP